MIEALYNYINNNPQVISLIGENSMYPIFSTNITKPGLVYNYKPGKKMLTTYQDILSINIIWSDFDEIIQIEKLLNKLLHFITPNVFVELDGYYFNSQNAGGGGYIYNNSLMIYEKTINFKITWKEL